MSTFELYYDFPGGLNYVRDREPAESRRCVSLTERLGRLAARAGERYRNLKGRILRVGQTATKAASVAVHTSEQLAPPAAAATPSRYAVLNEMRAERNAHHDLYARGVYPSETAASAPTSRYAVLEDMRVDRNAHHGLYAQGIDPSEQVAMASTGQHDASTEVTNNDTAWSEQDTAAFHLYAAQPPATPASERTPLFDAAAMIRIEAAFAAATNGPSGNIFADADK